MRSQMENKHMNMHDPEDRKKHNVDYRRILVLKEVMMRAVQPEARKSSTRRSISR